MTPGGLTLAIRGILLDSVGSGVLVLGPEAVPETVEVERPRNRNHGDWATNVVMQLAKRADLTPHAFAGTLTEVLRLVEGTDPIEAAGSGLTNAHLSATPAGEFARTTMQTADSYGSNSSLAGTFVNLEYVSANPTGPAHLGSARRAAVDDLLARLMAASGTRVTRGYCFNDRDSQVDHFAESLCAHAVGREASEDGYGNQYITDIAEKARHDTLQAGEANPIALPEGEAIEALRT